MSTSPGRRKQLLSRRSGLTITELLVAISIILVMIALLVPAVQASRALARSHACKNNLRQFGVSILSYSTRAPSGKFCSGAYDFRRDGCPDTWGWVADMVNTGGGFPQKMLCPSSELPGCQTLNDMIASSNAAPLDGVQPSRLSDGRCKQWTIGTIGTQQRITDVANLLEDGYGTNYAASWYLVRSAPIFVSGNTLAAPTGYLGTEGPLSIRKLAAAEIASSTLPLLGCATAGDLTTAILRDDLGPFAAAGSPLSESYGRGPAAWQASTITTMPAGTQQSAARPARLPRTAGPGEPGTDGRLWLQDTRVWYAWHGSGGQRHCNLLMADGSVHSVIDVNDDRYLNPGFNVSGEGHGYTDNEIELPSDVVFSGPFIEKQIPR